MEIAGRSVKKLVSTRIPINQTRSGILNGNESTAKDSSIVWIMVIIRKGYEKKTFKIKNPLTRMRITPMGRLLTITSWIFELNDKNAQTEKATFKIAAEVLGQC